MDWTGLKLMIKGIEIKQLKRKKRYVQEGNRDDYSGAAQTSPVASTRVDGQPYPSPQRG